jgi:predicted ArsR family transcriptional regulator
MSGRLRAAVNRLTARRVLAEGPVSPLEFAQALRVTPVRARAIVRTLAAEGFVVVTGKTRGRRIALVTRPDEG